MMTGMTDPTRRRFSPAPAWLIYGLLVAEGLLWFSERFQWFSFNEKKGWTVLIAVAIVGGAIILMLGWFVAALVLRWRFQFGIRSLLVLTVVIAVLCSWLAVEMKKAREQREVADEITKLGRLGGAVQYDWQVGAGHTFKAFHHGEIPEWLLRLLGVDFFSTVVAVDSTDTPLTDVELKHLAGLTELVGLWLDYTQITDAGLQDLARLRHLEVLSLNATKVTDAGVGKLQQALPNCKIYH